MCRIIKLWRSLRRQNGAFSSVFTKAAATALAAATTTSDDSQIVHYGNAIPCLKFKLISILFNLFNRVVLGIFFSFFLCNTAFDPNKCVMSQRSFSGPLYSADYSVSHHVGLHTATLSTRCKGECRFHDFRCTLVKLKQRKLDLTPITSLNRVSFYMRNKKLFVTHHINTTQ